MSSLKSVRTPKLDIGYEEQGNLDGFPIVLLHGFPYDIRSWDGVVPLLSANGFRVLVPYLRGFGATKIIDPILPKTGQQTAIAQDVIDFTQALGINHYALSGFDWGNRAACIASILNPKQVKALVTIGGYAVQNTVNPPGPASAVDEAKRWYVWYLNTKQGKIGLTKNRHDIIFHLWKSWAPKWSYKEETYKNSAKSFENEDFVDVVVHSYKHRQGNAAGEERFLAVEEQLSHLPKIDVPAIVLRGADNGLAIPSTDPTEDESHFTKLVARRIVDGAGHDLPVQRPDEVSKAFLDLLK